MGIVYAEITLKNGGDIVEVQRGHLKEPEIRQTTVRALVDTGAGTLVINDEIQQKLGLAIEGLRRSELADGAKQTYKLTEPVRIHWKDRDAACRALVVPQAGEVLLGAIPLEDLDLMVNPVNQELVGAHGNEAVYLIKSVSGNG